MLIIRTVMVQLLQIKNSGLTSNNYHIIYLRNGISEKDIYPINLLGCLHRICD